MTKFRGVGWWALGLVWLAVGVGCADTAEKKGTAKPEKAVSVETVLTDEPGRIIPLDKIWGHMISGAQDIRDLEPDHFGPAVQELPGSERWRFHSSSLSHQISQAIDRRSVKRQPIGPGFAVAGTGREALVAVKEIMEQDRMPSQTFPAGTEVSLFFFTRDSGAHIGLNDVKQSSETVTIRYHIQVFMAPHQDEVVSTLDLNRYFALIPFGKPAVGNYAVDVAPSLVEEVKEQYRRHYRGVNKEDLKKHVCQSFSFSIENG